MVNIIKVLSKNDFIIPTVDVKSSYYKNICTKMAKLLQKDPKKFYNDVIAEYNKMVKNKVNMPSMKGSEKMFPKSAIYVVIEKEDLSNVVPIDEITVLKMFDYIRASNPELMTMRSPFDTKLYIPVIYFNPPPQKLPPCDTAYVTENAEFVFNLSFLQKLCFFELVEPKKLKSLFYVSNGGNIPDYYSPIEFVMLHEFFHFLFGDHFFTKSRIEKWTKKYKSKDLSESSLEKIINECINIVGDYIINNKLGKMGLSFLPIGLYSETINYDNIDNYDKMFGLVLEEMIKEYMKNKDFMDKIKNIKMDQHVENPDGGTSQSGGGTSLSNKNKKEPGKGEEKEGKGEEKEGKGEEKEGKGGKEGSNSNDNKSSKIVDPNKDSDGKNIDKAQEKIDKIVNSNKKITMDKIEEALKKDMQKQLGKMPGSSNFSNNEQSDLRYLEMDLNHKPIFGWKQILKKMFSFKIKKEESWRKLNVKKTFQQQNVQKETGMQIVSPGLVKQEEKDLKLAFCIDESGSMNDSLSKIIIELKKLFETNKKNLKEVWIIRFSNSFHLIKINIIKNSYEIWEKVTSFKSLKNEKSLTKNGYINALKIGEYSSTNFSKHVVSIIEEMVQDGISVLLISDSDIILDKNNLSNFKKIIKLFKSNPNKGWVLFDSVKSFEQSINIIGNIKFISYILEE